MSASPQTTSKHTPAAPAGMRLLTQRDREVLAMPTIASQLPCRFANGFELQDFCGTCGHCRQEIDAQQIHGAITFPLIDVAVFEAIGTCSHCSTRTPYLLRMRDTGEFTTLYRSEWRSGTVRPLRNRPIDRLQQWIGRLLGKDSFSRDL